MAKTKRKQVKKKPRKSVGKSKRKPFKKSKTKAVAKAKRKTPAKKPVKKPAPKRSAAQRPKKSPSRQSESFPHNRQQPRVPLRIKIDYFKNPGVFLYDYSRNVGRGGIFVETEKPFQPGTELNLSFVLPDQGEPIEVKGKVVWVHEKNAKDFRGVPGMGVQFENPQGKNKEALDKFFREIDYDNLSF